MLTLLELLAVFQELVELSAFGLIPVQVVAEEGARRHSSLLHLLHLLDEYLSLPFIGLFKGFGSQVRAREVLHARLGQISGHFLELIELLVQDAHLLDVESLKVPLGSLLLLVSLHC